MNEERIQNWVTDGIHEPPELELPLWEGVLRDRADLTAEDRQRIEGYIAELKTEIAARQTKEKTQP
jgi:hypothetical protein